MRKIDSWDLEASACSEEIQRAQKKCVGMSVTLRYIITGKCLLPQDSREPGPTPTTPSKPCPDAWDTTPWDKYIVQSPRKMKALHRHKYALHPSSHVTACPAAAASAPALCSWLEKQRAWLSTAPSYWASVRTHAGAARHMEPVPSSTWPMQSPNL